MKNCVYVKHSRHEYWSNILGRVGCLCVCVCVLCEMNLVASYDGWLSWILIDGIMRNFRIMNHNNLPDYDPHLQIFYKSTQIT